MSAETKRGQVEPVAIGRMVHTSSRTGLPATMVSLLTTAPVIMFLAGGKPTSSVSCSKKVLGFSLPYCATTPINVLLPMHLHARHSCAVHDGIGRRAPNSTMQRLRCFCALVRLCKATARILGRVGFACAIQPQARDTWRRRDGWMGLAFPVTQPAHRWPPYPFASHLLPPVSESVSRRRLCELPPVLRRAPGPPAPSFVLPSYHISLFSCRPPHLATWLHASESAVSADRLICTGQLWSCSLPTCTCVSCVFVVFDAVTCHWVVLLCLCVVQLFVACVRVSCVRPSYKYSTSTKETRDNYKQEEKKS